MTLALPFKLAALKSKMATVFINPFKGIKPEKSKRRTSYALELVVVAVGDEFEQYPQCVKM